MKKLRFGVTALFVLALIFFGLKYYFGMPVREFRARVEHLQTEAEARESLGPPAKSLYPGDEALYVSIGYPCAEHPITHHALVYYGGSISRNDLSDLILFLYVNEDNTLSGYELCGT